MFSCSGNDNILLKLTFAAKFLTYIQALTGDLDEWATEAKVQQWATINRFTETRQIHTQLQNDVLSVIQYIGCQTKLLTDNNIHMENHARCKIFVLQIYTSSYSQLTGFEFQKATNPVLLSVSVTKTSNSIEMQLAVKILFNRSNERGEGVWIWGWGEEGLSPPTHVHIQTHLVTHIQWCLS